MAIKKHRAIENEERNKKIKDMDMEEVKKYLCMKNYQDPNKCDGCLSISTCNAGQRVMELKAEQKAKSDAPKMKRYGGGRRVVAENYVRQILAADSPHDFLMQNEGINYKQARKKLENLHRNHPEMFEGVEWPIRYNAHAKVQKSEEQVVGIDNEEVSLEEFLNSTDSVSASEIVEDAISPIPVEELKADSEHNACGIPNELVAKHEEICNEMNRIKQQINELQEQYNTLKKAENALSLTMSLISGRCDAKSVSKLVKFYEKGE